MPYKTNERATTPIWTLIVSYDLFRGSDKWHVKRDSIQLYINARPSQIENYMLETWKVVDGSVTDVKNLVIDKQVKI